MAYEVHISIPETRTIIELRGERLTLPHLPAWPPRPNSRTTLGAQSLIWTGPESCLLIAPLADEAALEAALAPLANDATSITNLSDTLSFFTLTGADAGVAMAIACPLDLHPTVFAPTPQPSPTPSAPARSCCAKARHGCSPPAPALLPMSRNACTGSSDPAQSACAFPLIIAAKSAATAVSSRCVGQIICKA